MIALVPMDRGSIAWGFIEALEGWSVRGYVPTDAAGRVLGRSGVTVGAGVDLGQWSADQLRRRGVPAALVERLAPWLGVRGAAAKRIAGDLVLTEAELVQLTAPIRSSIVAALAGRYDQAARRARFLAWGVDPLRAMTWSDLPVELRTVVASVGFQYGPALYQAAPNFWRQATTGDLVGLVANLRDFGDRYPTRRNREADFLAPLLRLIGVT